MTRKQHLTILVFAGLPLGLGIVLFLINPVFMGRMLTPNSGQPTGWLIMGIVFALVGAAYAIQRKAVLIGDRGKSIAFACSALFLVFPAMFLVLFGPVIVMLIHAGLYP